MTYIVDLNAYELYPKDESVLNNFTMNARVLHFTYDRDWLIDGNSKVYLYNYVDDYMWVQYRAHMCS